ncbi:hypothetical protein DY000_02058050 [Brassica cretica]|uniref:Uncharacterized protein n=1 Tax=Brassica cretica TaxID=69181 RepID=A0ABQ7A6J4_BRACR|nr:hypothetical protein DY000_02058050 [Brassica cretica]
MHSGQEGEETPKPAKGEELVIKTVEADEFLVAVSPEDVVAKEMVVREEDGPRGSAEERSGETGDERHELLFERWKMNILVLYHYSIVNGRKLPLLYYCDHHALLPSLHPSALMPLMEKPPLSPADTTTGGSSRAIESHLLKSERKLRVGVDENVERVDEFGSEDERVLDEIQEPAKGEELVIKTVEADEFLAAVSREDVVAKEMVVREEDGP